MSFRFKEALWFVPKCKCRVGAIMQSPQCSVSFDLHVYFCVIVRCVCKRFLTL